MTLFTWCIALLLLVAPALLMPAQAQTDFYIRSPRLGITHITHPSITESSGRYQNALLIGAGWHRFPVYWSDIERESGERVWDAFDRMVTLDVNSGLRTDLILLNVPTYRRDGNTIQNLYAPVFADGTDIPSAGKVLNPANYWGDFVAAAVRRYMPDGVLARQLGWGAGVGVRVWEAWNEPDLTMFWQASVADYARLLKVTYLVAHHIDSQARVMLAGLSYANPVRNDWLAKILAIYATDPDAPNHNWYMDIVALHTYVNAYLSPFIIEHAQATLARYDLERPIWLNETGVPAWDDYPGETWTVNTPGLRQYRVTMREQAQYMTQSTTMAWAAGADVIFIHQLYDDCAASPVGTTFPPHNGNLCTGVPLNQCTGEAFGLFRNERGAECFNQHPQPGSARPAAAAYYQLASIFGERAFALAGTLDLNAWGEAFVFDAAPQISGAAFDPARISLQDQITVPGRVTERIWVLWNWATIPLVLEIPALGNNARLHTPDDEFRLAPENGVYTVTLPVVNAANYPSFSETELNNIDGDVYFLVEEVSRGILPGEPALTMQGVGVISVTRDLPDAPTAVPLPADAVVPFIPTPIPTLDPMQDTTPPMTSMTPLPARSPSVFTVAWQGNDDSGIAEYIVWVSVDDGNWLPWLQTAEVTAEYTGETGKQYEFAVWAVDLAGNWSRNIDLQPMTLTQVE